MFSALAHNEALCRQAEQAINTLIDHAKEEGGMCWLQTKGNVEHHYALTEHISLCYFTPIQKLRKEDIDE